MGDLLKNLLIAAVVLMLATLLYGSVYNRETTLSYSIGYNLYAAERVLLGDVPYRDFHTLYPPGTLYLNALLFELLGVKLHTALIGVLVFKVLTVLTLYLCARQAMPAAWAFSASVFGLLWLRPNGPFKSVPMHYGALFLASGLYFLLRHVNRHGQLSLLLCGLSLGCLTLIKHNIGIYAFVGSVILLLVMEHSQARQRYRNLAVMAVGLATPLVPVVLAMHSQDALGLMTRTLLFGPGEFLLSRLVATPSPIAPAALVVLLSTFAYVTHRVRANDRMVAVMWIVALAAVCIAPVVSQSALDGLIFYGPVLVIGVGLLSVWLSKRTSLSGSSVVFAFAVFAGAAFMETFPRFAREQAIAAMPFVGLLIFYMIFLFKEKATESISGWLPSRIALATAPLLFLIIAARLLMTTYFDAPFKLRSDTPLAIERGRGVLFPKDIAAEIDEVVGYVRAKVPEGDYFFAHSYAGSSFLFLANRRNPSGAQFWSGVGVTPAEQASTLEALEKHRVQLIVTSERELAAEEYEPMRAYIAQRFQPSRRIGRVLILERNESR